MRLEEWRSVNYAHLLWQPKCTRGMPQCGESSIMMYITVFRYVQHIIIAMHHFLLVWKYTICDGIPTLISAFEAVV